MLESLWGREMTLHLRHAQVSTRPLDAPRQLSIACWRSKKKAYEGWRAGKLREKGKARTRLYCRLREVMLWPLHFSLGGRENPFQILDYKKMICEPESWLGSEHLLLLYRTCVWFSAHIWAAHKYLLTPVLVDMVPPPGLDRYYRNEVHIQTLRYTCKWNLKINQTNKSWFDLMYIFKRLLGTNSILDVREQEDSSHKLI